MVVGPIDADRPEEETGRAQDVGPHSEGVADAAASIHRHRRRHDQADQVRPAQYAQMPGGGEGQSETPRRRRRRWRLF